jgi:uncharacterized membrane protein
MGPPDKIDAAAALAVWLRRLLLLSLLCYPFALHLGLTQDRLLPAVLLLLGVLLLSGLMMLARGNRYGWLPLLLLLAAAAWLFVNQDQPQRLLKLPPILINGILCLLFGYTLLPGQRPLISRFAQIMHGHALDSQTQRYTRGVTLLWCLLFALMALESLLLGLWAEPRIWSLFTNFINYLVVFLVFFLEFRWRLRQLSHLEHPGFFGFLFALRRIEWRRLL